MKDSISPSRDVAVPAAQGRSPANRDAVESVLGVEPVLAALQKAYELMDWPERTLLHAGPPLRNGAVPRPVAHSAAHAAVFEGWAASFEEGLALIASGEVRLAPAQDHGCVTPLAAVVSPGQMMQRVSDANGLGKSCLAPLNGGVQHSMRLGMAAPEVLALLQWQNEAFARALVPAFRNRIDLLGIADRSLADGDDCHGNTRAGTQLLFSRLVAAGARLDDAAIRFVESSPGLFLTTWMAAARCMLSAAEGIAGSTLVTAMGANGVDAGIRLAGAPNRWTTMAATPPVGSLLDGWTEAGCLPAIGDSAVVDALGLGAVCMHHSPVQHGNLSAFMRVPSERISEALFAARHPAFVHREVRVGLCAGRVVETGIELPVSLGILDAGGVQGRIGGGIWHAPPALFAKALSTLP